MPPPRSSVPSNCKAPLTAPRPASETRPAKSSVSAVMVPVLSKLVTDAAMSSAVGSAALTTTELLPRFSKRCVDPSVSRMVPLLATLLPSSVSVPPGSAIRPALSSEAERRSTVGPVDAFQWNGLPPTIVLWLTMT